MGSDPVEVSPGPKESLNVIFKGILQPRAFYDFIFAQELSNVTSYSCAYEDLEMNSHGDGNHSL